MPKIVALVAPVKDEMLDLMERRSAAPPDPLAGAQGSTVADDLPRLDWFALDAGTRGRLQSAARLLALGAQRLVVQQDGEGVNEDVAE